MQCVYMYMVCKQTRLAAAALSVVGAGAVRGGASAGFGQADSSGDFSLLIDELHGSSGLQLKMDPGVPLVYAGTFTWFMPKSAHGVVPALPSRRCSRGQY